MPNHTARPDREPTAFLCHRKKDTGNAALILFDKLRDRVGGGLFYDEAKLREPGSPISETLRSAVDQASVVFVLVGERFLDGFDHPLDWVRNEVATALEVERRTVVVSVNGARLQSDAIDRLTDPTARDLAKQLRNLEALNLRLDHEHLENDVAAISKHLRQRGFPRPRWSTARRLLTGVTVAGAVVVAGIVLFQHVRLSGVVGRTPWIERTAAAAYGQPPQAADVAAARTALAELESGTRWLWFLENRRREYAATVELGSAMFTTLASGPLDPATLPSDADLSWRVAFAASTLLGQVAQGPLDQSLAALEGLGKLRESQQLDAEAKRRWQAVTMCSGVPVAQADLQARIAWVAVFGGIGLANAPADLCQSTFRDAMAARSWERLRRPWWRGDANRFEDAVARSMVAGLTPERLTSTLNEIWTLRARQIETRDNQTRSDARICALTTALCLLDHAVRRPDLPLDVPAVEQVAREVLAWPTADFGAALVARLEQWRSTDTDAARNLVAWVKTQTWNVATLASMLRRGG